MTPSILTAAQEGLRLAEKATPDSWLSDNRINFERHACTHHADICRAYLGLAKENADLRKKMGESDARFYGSAHTKKLMERLNGAQKDRDTARAENAELKRQLEEARSELKKLSGIVFEAENMALSLESAGFGRHKGGRMCTPLERYRAYIQP